MTQISCRLGADLQLIYRYRILCEVMRAGPLNPSLTAYDLNGNRLTETRNGVPDTDAYPTTNNRLSGITGGRTASYNYSLTGAIKGDGVTTNTYDDADRISKVAAGAVTLAGMVMYTPDGQRQRETVGSITKRFIYDRLTAEYSSLAPIPICTGWKRRSAKPVAHCMPTS